MNEQTNEFIDGLRVFEPREGAPSFRKYDLSIEREKLYKWLEDNHKGERYIKAQLLISREGKPYIKVDNFKPDPSYNSQQQTQPAPNYTAPPVQADPSGFNETVEDNIPF